MTDILIDGVEKPTEDFNALYLERKLVELVEEVRLRRNLEVENEKSLKSIMDEKYQEELSWDEQMRRRCREKEELEQQIDLVKRKLEDKVCVSDEEKAKQQVMNKTYSHEIRQLKEELRVSKSEKLNLQKKIQELEGKLKLHDNFQDSIINQISEVRTTMKKIFEESKELANSQRQVMENVASAKFTFQKFDSCNQHMQQCIEIYGKRNETLKRELISSRSEMTLLKQSVSTTIEKKNDYLEIEKLQNKILDLENLLLTSRQENVKTLNNFLDSNKLLCKFMDKYSEFQEREKKLTSELQLCQEKLHSSQTELQKAKDEIVEIEENAVLKEKERIENLCCTGMQTENASNQYCSCSKKALSKSSDDDKVTATLASFIPKAMENNFMDEFKSNLVNLEQNALVMQSEMSVNKGIHSFSLDQLCVNSADKKITLSQVLKRKLEIMESRDQFELIAMKKRFTENMAQSMIVVDNGVEENTQGKVPSFCKIRDQPLCSNLNSVVSVSPPSLHKNDMLISHKASYQPLGNKLNSVISLSPPSDIKNETVMSHEINDQSLFNMLNQDISSSSFENEIVISHETRVQPSCINLDVSLCPPSVDILLDQKYLSYKKYSGKVNEKGGKENTY